MLKTRVALLVSFVDVFVACGGAPTQSAGTPAAVVETNQTRPAEAAEPPSEVLSVGVGPSVAGLPLDAPAACKLELEPPRGGSIHCPGAILTWLNATGNDLDDVAAQVESNGFPILERTAIGCRVGEIDGEGDVLMIEHQGAQFPVFVCVVPYEGAHTVVRCTGYDPRVMPKDNTPVPAPCDQIITYQPVLIGKDPP